MPSLIVFFIFLGILELWNFLGNLGKIKSNLDININTSSVKQRYRYIWKNTFLFGTAYIMIFLLSYFLKDEKDLGDKANIIVKLANAYLKIELLVVLIMFFAFMYIFLVNKNKKAYFEFLKKPIVILLYLSAFSYAVTHQIELGYNSNWIPYIGLAVFSILIFSVDIKDKIIENEQKEIRNLYKPINSYEGLCKSHKDKANTLKNIIERNSDCGGISILVKGDWGIGKTSVVNGAIQKLKEDSKYEELRINALEIDSLESLFNYFFDFIRRCLKERGAYTGIASEYREFVSSALGIVTTESFGNVFTRFFYSENKGYREKKEELEKSIGNVLGNDKIIIVVDDIERCEKEKVKQFIFFIKEIATMDNCITIFISDENALKECILNDNNSTMDDFLDKFFNYTVSVNTTDYEDILEKIEKQEKQEKNIDNSLGFFTLKEVIRKIIENLDNKLNKYEVDMKSEKEKYKNQVENNKKTRNSFISDIRNPRKLTKLYKTYINYINIVNNNVFELNNDQRELYFNKIKASETLFILSYIAVYFPEQFYNIEKNKIDNYLETLNQEKMSGKSEIILEIADGYWFEKSIDKFYLDYTSNYLYKKTITFLKNIMDNKGINDNAFTSQEDEWVSCLPKSKHENIHNWKEIEQNWLKVLEVLILKRSYDMKNMSNKETIKEYEDKILFLLDGVYECSDNKNNIFEIFRNNNLMHIIFKNIGVVNLIKDRMCSDYIKPDFVEKIFDFHKKDSIKNIFRENLIIAFKVLFYLGDYEEETIKYKLDTFRRSTNFMTELQPKINLEIEKKKLDNLYNKCSEFKMELIVLVRGMLSEFSKALDFIKRESSLGVDVCIFNEFEDLFIFIEKYMEKNGWENDEIFKRELEKAKLSINDLKAFVDIVKFYSRESVVFSKEDNLNEIDIDNNINIYNIISFVKNLKESAKNLNLEQKHKLDLIIDEYEEKLEDIDCNKYRRILLEHTEKKNQK